MFLGVPTAFEISRDGANLGAGVVTMGPASLPDSGVGSGVVSGVGACVGSGDNSVSVSMTLSSADVGEALTANKSAHWFVFID